MHQQERTSRTDSSGAQLPHFPPPLSSPTLKNINIPLPQPNSSTEQQTLHLQPHKPQDSPTSVAHPNSTSSAPETVLVCQSRISKLSTRSRKRMKIPARSSRVSRTTFTFVSSVCPVFQNCLLPVFGPAIHCVRTDLTALVSVPINRMHATAYYRPLTDFCQNAMDVKP